jgi:hypothetical protein
VNVVKVAPESALKFFVYDQVKAVLCRDPSNPQLHERFLSGATAGAISQVTPFAYWRWRCRGSLFLLHRAPFRVVLIHTMVLSADSHLPSRGDQDNRDNRTPGSLRKRDGLRASVNQKRWMACTIPWTCPGNHWDHPVCRDRPHAVRPRTLRPQSPPFHCCIGTSHNVFISCFWVQRRPM